jgi:hypothetical protein
LTPNSLNKSILNNNDNINDNDDINNYNNNEKFKNIDDANATEEEIKLDTNFIVFSDNQDSTKVNI